MTVMQCHVCADAGSVRESTPRVTTWVSSDCRPLHSFSAAMGLCTDCGNVVLETSRTWVERVTELYRVYNPHLQSSVGQQGVFKVRSGASIDRSILLAEFLHRSIGTLTGSWLDFGCGNGDFLRAAGSRISGLTWFGADLNYSNAEIVRSISTVEDFYSVADLPVNSEFTGISLIHVLEHLVHPASHLEELRSIMVDGGLLFVQVPDWERNPFDLTIYDHASHFSVYGLKHLLSHAGFEVEAVDCGVVPREISIVARKSPMRTSDPSIKQNFAYSNLSRSLNWLSEGEHWLRTLIDVEYGILGTSIGGCWAKSILDRKASFWVDEDPHRAGRQWLGSDIFPPADVPRGSKVIVPLSPTIGPSVVQRLSREFPDCSWEGLPRW